MVTRNKTKHYRLLNLYWASVKLVIASAANLGDTQDIIISDNVSDRDESEIVPEIEIEIY